MAVRAIGEYKFPSRSRQELYGDDQLVNVWWKGNPFFVSAAMFRFPKAMPWADFVGVMKGFFAADPDFVPDSLDTVEWVIDGAAVTPVASASLVENGVGHKSLIEFSV